MYSHGHRQSVRQIGYLGYLWGAAILVDALWLWRIQQYSPPRGTVLWACRGKSIDWCCRHYLWAQYRYPPYPTFSFEARLGADERHAAMTVEAIVTGFTDLPDNVFTPDPSPDIIGLGCVSTRTDQQVSSAIFAEARWTGFLWYYPCWPKQQFERFVQPAKFNSTIHITKGRCRGVTESSLRQLVRASVGRSCIRRLINLPGRVLRLSTQSQLHENEKVHHQYDDHEVHASVILWDESPLLTIKDLNKLTTQSTSATIKKTWTDKLILEHPNVGHTYLACAAGALSHDLEMELALI